MAKSMVGGFNLADAGSLTATSANLAFPVSNLLDPTVQHIWETVAGVSSATLLLDLGSRQDINVLALFGTDLTAAATVAARVSTVDATGAAGDAYSRAAAAAGVDPEFRALILVLSQASSVNGRYVAIDLADASLTKLSAGRLVVAKLTQLQHGTSKGRKWSVDDGAVRSRTKSGATFVEAQWVARVCEAPFNFLTQAEADQFHLNDLGLGLRKDMLYIGDPADANLGKVSIWGLLDSLVEITQPEFSIFQRTLKIVERL